VTWNRGGRTSPDSSSANFRRSSATGARIFRSRNISKKNGVPGIQGIDTRALTKKLRVRGAMNGFIPRRKFGAGSRQAREGIRFVGVDYVKESRTGRVPLGRKGRAKRELQAGRRQRTGQRTSTARAAAAADIPIVAFDYGMKYNILRRLRQHALPYKFCRPPVTAADALKHKPAGFFCPMAPATRRRSTTLCAK